MKRITKNVLSRTGFELEFLSLSKQALSLVTASEKRLFAQARVSKTAALPIELSRQLALVASPI